ncbi:phage terminase small subunit P27 family [Clostridium pasteurianum]|uniref:Phage terminase, small subunit, putative, P27 family n=1 Tax=Clostridium pasteurianum BC1 TaxID=86416 RepID=R4K7B0_CLOPA|nr:phage terminase small subunit P27 family [Clostridium pasteurianum]AGK97586.1 phage terminase, small subunit, putative, P27 family [Clostridium pasteurianum BC1]
MERASKPVDLQASHLTKEEIQQRKQAEQKLKGNDDLVYKPPRHLSKDEKKLYKFLVQELQASGILNNLDITILETTVDAIVRMQECKKILDEHGLVTPKSDGTFVRNPASTIYKDYNAIFNKCCMEIGFSPSARAKLSVMNVKKEQDKQDPLLQILSGDSNG